MANQARRSERAPADAAGEPIARLAASQLRRVRRIVDAAAELAEAGGFEGVRLREVADASGVALGTLYKYFRSKEDILLFAVNEEAVALEQAMVARPVTGETPMERLEVLFQRATRAFLRRPDFARAVLRSIASGNLDTAVKVAGFHMRVARMVQFTLAGTPLDLDAPLSEPVGDERDRELALMLNQVWFAALVGWAGGLHPVKTVVDRVVAAARLAMPDGGRS